MFTKALSRQTIRALEVLGKSGVVSKAYLAGGTALALRFGHRLSVDLDFFTDKFFDERIFLEKLQAVGEFEKQEIAKQTVLGRFMKVKFSIFYYEYPLLGKVEEFKRVKIANFEDLAAMKLQAIGDRGARRDFIDLYWLRGKFSLEEVFALYNRKFGKVKEGKYHLLKALRYFEDADRDRMPKMLEPVEWSEVKSFFEAEVRRLSKKWQIA